MTSCATLNPYLMLIAFVAGLRLRLHPSFKSVCFKWFPLLYRKSSSATSHLDPLTFCTCRWKIEAGREGIRQVRCEQATEHSVPASEGLRGRMAGAQLVRDGQLGPHLLTPLRQCHTIYSLRAALTATSWVTLTSKHLVLLCHLCGTYGNLRMCALYSYQIIFSSVCWNTHYLVHNCLKVLKFLHSEQQMFILFNIDKCLLN